MCVSSVCVNVCVKEGMHLCVHVYAYIYMYVQGLSLTSVSRPHSMASLTGRVWSCDQGSVVNVKGWGATDH